MSPANREADDSPAEAATSDSEGTSDSHESESRSASSEGEGEEDSVQELLKNAPFEDLQKMRSVGEGGNGAWKNKAVFRPPKRENKNKPQELSSKRPVPRFRRVIETASMDRKDPRFESLCGELDENRFSSAYGFLFSEQLPAEQERIRKLLKKEKDATTRENHKEALRKIDQQLKQHEAQKRRKERETESRRTQKAAVVQGKAPFFQKKSEKRKQELIEKFQELKSKGQLETFLAKRRRKNASKEHKNLPRRQTA